MSEAIDRCEIVLEIYSTNSYLCAYGDMLVTTSGILQEQKFSKPRSIGYFVLEPARGSIANSGRDKLQEVLVELLWVLGVGEDAGSGSRLVVILRDRPRWPFCPSDHTHSS